jgi:arginine deiminase
MALDVVDHVLLGMAQRQHERFLKQLRDGELRELRERLATKTAANEGHLAIINALVDAYEQGDRTTVDNILSNCKLITHRNFQRNHFGFLGTGCIILMSY